MDVLFRPTPLYTNLQTEVLPKCSCSSSANGCCV